MKQHPKHLSIEDFSYALPEEKIAAFPLQQRDQSKLLVYRNSAIQEDVYANIAGHLPAESLLVFNNTKVIEARLLFQKPTGGMIEIFILEPDSRYSGLAAVMQEKEKAYWKCLIGGAGKWKRGQVMQKVLDSKWGNITLEARIVAQLPGSFGIEFSWTPADISFGEVLHLFGEMPIPPYLKRAPVPSDEERYQTIFASSPGSVAAPTAGLHFTDHIFGSLKAKGISMEFVTLHVGAGTFMPVKSNNMEGHTMHAEYIDIAAELIHALSKRAGHLFAVGTTSLRTLESLYWMGVKCFVDNSITLEDLALQQWEVYDELQQHVVTAEQALQALTAWMERNKLQQLVITTKLLIAPGYKVKMVSGLITNFHQPHSTLLLLVAALLGEAWRSVYDYALQHDFRFLSFGDGCLLYIPKAETASQS